MKRKPIQIAVAPESEDTLEVLFALCADGSIWFIKRPSFLEPGGWERMPDIPQDDDALPPERASEPKPAALNRGNLAPRDAAVLAAIAGSPGARGLLEATPNVIATVLRRLLNKGYIAGNPKVGDFTVTEAGMEALLPKAEEIREPVSAPE